MKAVLCQLELAWEDPGANYSKIRRLLAGRDDLAGSLIVLPEMLATGFSMDVAAVAAGEPGRTQGFLAELAQSHRATVLGGFGIPHGDRRGRNVAVAMDPSGTRIAEYTKIHPFSYGGEDERYQAGDAVASFGWSGFQVCPLICYDLRFPEVFRAGAGLGAELFCVIANWPIKRVSHWITLLQARAIENQAYVVGVNRVGSGGGLDYSGDSAIIDPLGEVLATGAGVETVLLADLDAAHVAATRDHFRFLQDRR